IFNLEQTHFLLPHWFTEGLAVLNEGVRRPPSWYSELAERLAADDVLNLDTIDLGFIRPRDPLQWQMAYFQASLYVEYIKKEYGPQAIGIMLAAFAAGDDVGAALAKGCKGVGKDQFEKNYRKYLQSVLDEAGVKKVEKPRTLAQLQAEYK